MEKETKQETQDKQEKPKRNKKKIAIIAVLVIIAGAFCATSLDRVGQGEVGVVYTMRSGVQDKTLSPGYHFIAPWATVKHYPGCTAAVGAVQQSGGLPRGRKCRLACGRAGKWRYGEAEYDGQLQFHSGPRDGSV